MKTDLIGKGIVCESEEHGQAIKRCFEDNGVNVYNCSFTYIGEHYYIFDDMTLGISKFEIPELEIIELPKSYWPVKKEKTFPREMEVSDYIGFPKKHTFVNEVLCDLGEEYMYRFVTCLYKDDSPEGYKYAREIEKKELFFVTDDGEKIFMNDGKKTYRINMYSSGESVEDDNTFIFNTFEGKSEDCKYFFHKENAIKYIKQRDWKEGEWYFVRDSKGYDWQINKSANEYARFKDQNNLCVPVPWRYFVKCPEGFELPKE